MTRFLSSREEPDDIDETLVFNVECHGYVKAALLDLSAWLSPSSMTRLTMPNGSVMYALNHSQLQLIHKHMNAALHALDEGVQA